MNEDADRDVSPAEAQNTGPFHRTPPGPAERTDAPNASGPPSPVRPGGEPETRDDR